MIPKEEYTRNSTRVDLARYRLIFYYKFVTLDNSFTCPEIFTGKLLNLSASGAQVCGSLPSLKLLTLLGQEKLYIGCKLPVPTQLDGSGESQIKVLSRVRWAKSEAQEGQRCHQMGLEFIKISDTDKQSLKNYLVRQQIRTAKINRTLELIIPTRT